MEYLKYLQSLEKFGIHLGLDRINFLLQKLGNPQFKFKSIHVAGTNGKGSTCAMMASILKEAGYKVGLYTSPHLFDYAERIKINGKDISKKKISEGIRRVRKAAEGMREKPTIFETLTAVAFWFFAKEKVDYAVVEVGMGGRLDATNVITPLVSVITNIDYEHTEVLGKSLSRIAREKAGIIKPGVPVVTTETKAEPIRVMKEVAEKNRSILVVVSSGQAAINSNLIGTHQKLNAACAVAAMRMAGIKISKRVIAVGLQKVKWPARFQVISRKPLTVIDGAHNPAGVKVLRVTIEEIYPNRKFTLIFGCQKDKDAKKMLKALKPVSSKIIITRSSHPNAASPRKLADFSKIRAEVAESVENAISRWDKEGPLLVAGSLFIMADALKYLDAGTKS